MKSKPTIKRFFAFMIDMLIVTFIATAFAQIDIINPTKAEYETLSTEYMNLIEGSNGSVEMLTSENMLNITYQLNCYGIYISAINLVFIIIYFVLFQYFNDGKTIGKALFKIKVISKDNKKLKLSQILVRSLLVNSIITTGALIICLALLNKESYLNVSSYIQMVDMGIIFLCIGMVIMRDDGVGFHDLLAGTRVIDTRYEKQIIEEAKYVEKVNKSSKEIEEEIEPVEKTEKKTAKKKPKKKPVKKNNNKKKED